MSMSARKVRIITHSGSFHADELFAVAALEMYLNGTPYEVVRTRDPEVWKTGDFLVDVGGVYDPQINRYDHHQHGGAGERSGVPYSSFGLVWKHFGEAITGSKEVADGVERRLVWPIDMADNGVEVYHPVRRDIHPYMLHHVVSASRPTWKEGATHDMRFLELIPLMRRILEREVVRERDRIEGVRLVRGAYEAAPDKRLIVIDGHYPWEEELSKYPEPLYVVKPKWEGPNWEVECVRDDVHTFKTRKAFPPNWCGLFDEQLAMVTGVEGSVFCHNNGYIVVAKSKEDALKLAELALVS